MVALLRSFSASLSALLRPLTGLALKTAMLVLALMSVPIVIDILLRLFASASVPGVVELEEFAMVFVVFFAIAAVQEEEAQVRIDLVAGLVSERVLKALDFFNALLSCSFMGILAWCATVQGLKKMSEVSFSLKLPLGIFILFAALGLLLLTLVLLSQLLAHLADMLEKRAFVAVFLAVTLCAALLACPWWIKAAGLKPPNLVLGGWGMLLLLSLLLLRLPIGFAMGLVGWLGLMTLYPVSTPVFTLVGVAPYSSAASFLLAVIPLFILMGELCLRAGISNDLINAAATWLGRLPGGLAIASVAGCAGFAAVCGDSMATAVTMGSVALPEMRRKNYSLALACGSLAAGGTLGILIPPSIGFIFYAIITEESVGKLFAAGVVPGLVLAGLFMLTIYIMARRNPALAPRGEAATLTQKLRSLKGVVFMMILFTLILGGIFSGWFSPTEGGAVGAAGALVLALIRRRLSWKGLIASLHEAALFSSKLIIILVGVGILSYFLAATRLPMELAALLTGLNMPPYAFLAAIILLFTVLGCVMNVIPMLLLTLPALYPTVLQMGFDPVWFGVVTVLVMEMGQITPPVGVNVFAIGSVAPDVPLVQIFKGVFPFVLVMLFMILLLVLFPGMATWLPGLLFN